MLKNALEYDLYAAKATADGIIYAGISYIDYIQPSLHRCTFSCDHSYEYLSASSDKICVYNQPSRRKRYRTQGHMLIDDLSITFFTNRVNSFFPMSILEVTLHPDSEKFILHKLHKCFPGIKCSRIEYALDFHVGEPWQAEDLFDLFYRHLIVRYARTFKLYQSDMVYCGRSRTLHFGRNQKLYERGNDQYREPDGGWSRKTFNRVRLEYSPERITLKRHGISSLTNLIESPKFAELHKGRYRFLRTKPSSGTLPQYWDGFAAPDDEGNMGAFSLEIIAGRSRLPNVHQNLEPIPAFNKLFFEMESAMADFDSSWRRQHLYGH